MAEGHLPGIPAKPQPLQCLLDAEVVFVPPRQFKVVLQPAVLLQQSGIVRTGSHRGFQGVKMLLLCLQTSEDGEHFSIHGAMPVGEGIHGFLAQVTKPPVFRKANLSGGWLVDACQDEKQGRFTNTVGTDETNLGIVGNVNGDAAEEVKISEG